MPVPVFAGLAFAGLALVAPRPAAACAFHLYAPEKTAIDWLLAADRLVVARNTADSPFAYHPVEVLRGAKTGIAIPQLVDARTRTRFARDPGGGVLFAFDAATGDWRSLAYLTPAYRDVIDRVLRDMGGWQAGYDPARFAIFAALQDHAERDLRTLALREIDKAPYALLRGIELRLPAEALLADLWSTQGYSFQSIRILLLGLSADDAARRTIRGYIERAADRDALRNLGAFATALVEIDGAEGLALLDRQLLSDPAQPLGKIEQVVEALAIHNDVGTPEMRARIAAVLARLVAARPDTAAAIARQFGSRQDWTQANRLAPLVAERQLTDAAGLMAVAVYLAQAKAAQASGANAPDG